MLNSYGHIIRTNTRDSRIPVLSSLPDAYWVTGDAGLTRFRE